MAFVQRMNQHRSARILEDRGIVITTCCPLPTGGCESSPEATPDCAGGCGRESCSKARSVLQWTSGKEWLAGDRTHVDGGKRQRFARPDNMSSVGSQPIVTTCY